MCVWMFALMTCVHSEVRYVYTESCDTLHLLSLSHVEHTNAQFIHSFHLSGIKTPDATHTNCHACDTQVFLEIDFKLN